MTIPIHVFLVKERQGIFLAKSVSESMVSVIGLLFYNLQSKVPISQLYILGPIVDPINLPACLCSKGGNCSA